MRQVAILPSGCQVQHSNSILFYDQDRIFYASTLAVYVINAKTFGLERILSATHKVIRSISVSSHDKNILVVGTVDGAICCWDIMEETVISRVQIGSPVEVLLDPHFAQRCILVLNYPHLRVLYWDTENSDKSLSGISELLSVNHENLSSTITRMHPTVAGRMAIGCVNGTIIIFNHVDQQRKFLTLKNRATLGVTKVIDLQWDHLSPLYLLVAYETLITLWDVESGEEIQTFERQNVEITAIVWMDWTAGNFISSNVRNSNLKVWNASQKHPLQSIKINAVENGIKALKMCKNEQKLLCAIKDGSILIYNFLTSQVEFLSPAGHTETIFDSKISPHNPDLFCSGSYDGTVKIWDTTNLTLQKTLYGVDDIIYSCDWSPKGNALAAVSYTGLLTIWDVETGRELVRYLHHTKACYCVAWNKLTENLICTTSADETVVIINVDLTTLYDPYSKYVPTGSRRKTDLQTRKNIADSDIKLRFQHPRPVFGCAWSPTHAPIFATGCQDNLVRVFNHQLPSPLLYVLKGHTLRAFSCAWSSLLPGYLATGSDDKCVIVWEVNMKKALTGPEKAPVEVAPKQYLSGHTNNVRALLWNTEHRHLLFSGSWDSTIRLWDAINGTCLYVLRDHVADVYALSSHPQRPFSLLSASRDSTIRLWEMEGVVSLLRYSAVFYGCLDQVIDGGEEEGSGVLSEVLGDLSVVLTEWTAMEYYQMLISLKPLVHGDYSYELNKILNGKDPGSFDEKFEDKRNSEDTKASGKTSVGGSNFKKFKRNFVESPLDQAINFYKIFSFFNGSSGANEIWEMIINVLQNREAPAWRRTASFSGINSLTTGKLKGVMTSIRDNGAIEYEGDVLHIAKSEAMKIESSRMSVKKVDYTGKIEESLRKAAMMYVRSGDFQKYCQLMIELNDWPAALSMAPGVSMEYWKILSQRYAQHLQGKADETCVPHFLSIGKDAEVVDFYLKRRETRNAMIVAKFSEKRTDLIPDYITKRTSKRVDNRHETYSPDLEGRLVIGDTVGRNPSRSNSKALSISSLDGIDWADGLSTPERHTQPRKRGSIENDLSRLIVQAVAGSSSMMQLSVGRLYLAVAQYLAVENVDAAINTLVNNLEPDFAFAVAVCFGLKTDPILVLLAHRCANLCALELAVTVLQSIEEESDKEIALLISKYCTSKQSKLLISKFKLKSTSSWATVAKEEMAIGSDVEAVGNLIMSQDFTSAAKLAIKIMKKNVREPWNDGILTSSPKNTNGTNEKYPKKTNKLMKYLRCLRASELDESQRLVFLCYFTWFSAHEAFSLGLYETAVNMLRVLTDKVSLISFDISPQEIQYQALFFKIFQEDYSCISEIEGIIVDRFSDGSMSDVGNSWNVLRGYLQEAKKQHQHHQEVFFGSSVVSRMQEKAVQSNLLIPMEEGKWGASTNNILRELQKLCLALSLPSLTHGLNKNRLSGDQSNVKNVQQPSESVLLGSLLPTANQNIKNYTSILTKKRIQGKAIMLGDGASYVGINEISDWLRVNPFSPLLNGDFVFL